MLVTNGSMQADAFLFDELVGAGDAVVVERPSYDRTLLSLRQRGAALDGDPAASPTASTSTRSRRRSPAACDRSSPTSSPTSTTPPATRCRDPSASACSSSPASTASRSSKTTPTSRCASAARRCRRCSRSTPAAAASSTPRRSQRPSAPASASAISIGPPELIARIVVRATNTYISPSMVDAAIVYEFCALRRDRPLDRDASAARSRSAPGRSRARCASRSPARRSSPPTAATSCG